jgi:transmembrane sensor
VGKRYLGMNPSNDSAEIEAAAAAWFARREGGAWTPSDQAALEAWLNAATAHRIAYLRLAAGWERSGRLKALGAGIPAGTIPPRDAWGYPPGDNPSEPPVGSTKPSWLTRRFAAMAAGLAAVTVAVAVWTSMTHSPVYSTQVGVLATVPLPDGSTITLNTDSRIHVNFTSTEREVTLDRGEAFFEVSKDPGRPFVVQIGNKRVTAIGTQFTVRRDQGDIRVLVTEGLVQVVRETLLSHSPATPVAAGSEARTHEDAVFVDQPKPAQVDESLSWRSGYLVFHDTPLAEAITEFNRYNTRKIVIADPTIATLRIGGRFRFTDSEAFLWLLKNGFPINVAKDSTGVRLTRR